MMLLLIKPGKGMFHWKNVLRRLPSSSVRSVRLFSLRPLEEAGRPTESFSCGAGEQQTSHPSHPPNLSLSLPIFFLLTAARSSVLLLRSTRS
jgi:hypothetical protein